MDKQKKEGTEIFKFRTYREIYKYKHIMYTFFVIGLFQKEVICDIF